MTESRSSAMTLLSQASITCGDFDWPRQVTELPAEVGGPEKLRGFLYVVLFANGTVKPGRTTRPLTRFAGYATTAQIWLSSMERVWLSPDIRDHLVAERDLLNWCTDKFSMIGTSEYYLGADFDLVVTEARSVVRRYREAEKTQPPPLPRAAVARMLGIPDCQVPRFVRAGHLEWTRHRKGRFITAESWRRYLESTGVEDAAT